MSHTVAAEPRNRKPIGPYSKPHRLAKLDGRRREAKLMAELRAELTRHVGAPSAVQRQLIERAAVLHLRIELMDARAPDGAMTEKTAREYLCWHGAYVRTLGALGLKGAADGPPSLAERIARDSAAPPSPLAWAVPPPGPVRRPEPAEDAGQDAQSARSLAPPDGLQRLAGMDGTGRGRGGLCGPPWPGAGRMTARTISGLLCDRSECPRCVAENERADGGTGYADQAFNFDGGVWAFCAVHRVRWYVTREMTGIPDAVGLECIPVVEGVFRLGLPP